MGDFDRRWDFTPWKGAGNNSKSGKRSPRRDRENGEKKAEPHREPVAGLRRHGGCNHQGARADSLRQGAQLRSGDNRTLLIRNKTSTADAA